MDYYILQSILDEHHLDVGTVDKYFFDTIKKGWDIDEFSLEETVELRCINNGAYTPRLQHFTGNGYFSVFSLAMADCLRPFCDTSSSQWLKAHWPEIDPADFSILYCRTLLDVIDHDNAMGERCASSGMYSSLTSLVLDEAKLKTHAVDGVALHVFRLDNFPRLLILSAEAKAACAGIEQVGFAFIPVSQWASDTPQTLASGQ